MDLMQPETVPRNHVSPMQISDRLVQLARDAEGAGLRATAAVLVGMARMVLEPEGEPAQEPWR